MKIEMKDAYVLTLDRDEASILSAAVGSITEDDIEAIAPDIGRSVATVQNFLNTLFNELPQ